jgi:hypothetical protein
VEARRERRVKLTASDLSDIILGRQRSSPPQGEPMRSLVTLLAENQLLLLFVIIGLGYLIGNIRIAGFQLGVVAVLFVGIFFGALDKRLGLPEFIYVIGLVLFVYAIGLQSGTGFFASFK